MGLGWGDWPGSYDSCGVQYFEYGDGSAGGGSKRPCCSAGEFELGFVAGAGDAEAVSSGVSARDLAGVGAVWRWDAWGLGVPCTRSGFLGAGTWCADVG